MAYSVFPISERVSLAPMVWVVEVPANSTMPLYIYFNYLRSADFITNTIITGGMTTLPPGKIYQNNTRASQ